MNLRSVTIFMMRAVACVLSVAVGLYGIYSFIAADLRQDTGLVLLFCLLPALTFPIFLLSFRRPRIATAALWLIAAAYLVVYSLLDWRTCAELNYCDGILNNVFRTLSAGPLEACIAVAVFSQAALFMRGNWMRQVRAAGTVAGSTLTGKPN
jgi:hypothetical protein